MAMAEINQLKAPHGFLKNTLTFGFEQTFTIPAWWTEPGFVSVSDTPMKREKMLALAGMIAEELRGTFRESLDMYGHLQYETFEADGSESFVVTMDPGSIEVKTPPYFFDQIEVKMEALFLAAEKAEVVPYRQWWYGVRKGTEGGCHLNLGGMTPETNPLRLNPELLLKYVAYCHNRPWLHYPFMGVDAGPGGNAIRMDEHLLPEQQDQTFSDSSKNKYDPSSITQFEKLRKEIILGRVLGAEEISEVFTGTPMKDDKHSAPSLYKFHAPLYLTEERAIESLRSAKEARMIAELRLRALEMLCEDTEIESLKDFGSDLHIKYLNSETLWKCFQESVSSELELDPKPYQIFFDRQFPVLLSGDQVPTKIQVREGRRPRVITDVKRRGELVISKTIDTRYQRFELSWTPASVSVSGGEPFVLICNSETFFGSHALLDMMKEPDQVFDLELRGQQSGHLYEKAQFHLDSMMYRPVVESLVERLSEIPQGYRTAKESGEAAERVLGEATR